MSETGTASGLAAFGRVFRNRDLRRVQLAGIGSIMGLWGYIIALFVWAYDAGGPGLVGLAAFVRLAPAAFAAPFAGALADRMPRRRIMVSSDLIRAVSLALAALAIAEDAPVAIVLVLVSVNGIAGSAFRPAEAALLPSITSTPEELTAANVVASAVESVGSFAGPALGGLLLVVGSPELVFAASVVCLLWSALLVSGVRGEVRPKADEEAPRILRAVADGFRASASGGNVRLILGLVAAQTLVAGLLNVLVVVIALEMLERGDGWVGLLNGAIGVGGLIGVGVSASVVLKRGIASVFGAGTVLFGAPLLLVAAWEEPLIALVAMALIGVGNTLADVSSMTLLQRAVDDHVLARVFAVLESIAIGTIAIGGLLAPVTVNVLGERGALLLAGALLPLIVLLTWRPLRALDAAAGPPVQVLDLFRALPVFAPLPQPVLERLAFDAELIERPAGVIFAQGDPGDRFYVIAQGTVDIAVDGEHVRTESRGDAFGEIALLRNTPRTATVTASTPVTLYALGRDAFVTAVTGHPASAEAAEQMATTRLATAGQVL